MLHLPLHAGVAAAREGTADFNAVHGGHHPAAGPIRAQNSVAPRAASHLAAEGEDGPGRLTLERIADGVGGGIKAAAQLNLLAHLLDQLGRNVEGFRFPLDEHGNLKLHLQVLAVGAMTVGPATSPLAFDEGAGQHLAESTKAADEPTARLKFRVAGHFGT
jgi:hypothetical protein